MEAAREATATSKRLRTRLKSAKVRFELNPEERKKNMRSSFISSAYKKHPSHHYFPLYAKTDDRTFTDIFNTNK